MAAFASAIGLTGAFAGETQPGTLCDSPGAAIRSGDWKLIEFYEFDEIELYLLDQDLGESRDLSLIYPEKKGSPST